MASKNRDEVLHDVRSAASSGRAVMQVDPTPLTADLATGEPKLTTALVTSMDFMLNPSRKSPMAAGVVVRLFL
ncbi:MAG: hypothetical protein NDI61_08135 [Bdellovibrionaceae bacterium]|nr:hypothetical protein [Pseudobdellovibrionaceae bacterium]